jgi:hypothetical protein
MTSLGELDLEIERERSRINALCRLGGIASLILVAYSLATMVQMVVLGGQPTSAAQAFGLLEQHRVIALLRLDLPTIISLPLYYVVFLGLFAALRRCDFSGVLLATTLAFVGTTLVLATPTALSLIPLSDKFAMATSDASRTQLLAAGEALLAGRHMALDRRHRWRSATSVRCGADLGRDVTRQGLQQDDSVARHRDARARPSSHHWWTFTPCCRVRATIHRRAALPCLVCFGRA